MLLSVGSMVVKTLRYLFPFAVAALTACAGPEPVRLETGASGSGNSNSNKGTKE